METETLEQKPDISSPSKEENVIKKQNGLKKELISIKLSRHLETGNLLVHVKGDSKIFRPVIANPERVVNVHGIATYHPKHECLSHVNGYFYFGTHMQNLIYSDFPILSFILAKELDNGVTYDLGQVCKSETFLRDFLTKFKEGIKQLYQNYLKPLNVSMTIYTEERLDI